MSQGLKSLSTKICFLGAMSFCLAWGLQCYGFQEHPNQVDLNLNQDDSTASPVAQHFEDFERKFGFKLLAETIKASKDQSNQMVAPYGLFDCLHFLSNVTQGPAHKELKASLFQAAFEEQLLSKSVELRKSLEPQEGNPVPSLVAKNFLLYDQANSLTNDGRPRQLELFGVNALAVDWSQELSVASTAKSIEATFEKLASGRMGKFNYEPPKLDAGSFLFLNLSYFKDQWFDPFDPNKTQNGVFHLSGTQQTSVQYISGQGRSGKWLENRSFKLVELPYRSLAQPMSMVLVLPNKGFGDGQVIEELDRLNCLAAVDQRPQWGSPAVKYDIKVPKFKIKKQIELVKFCRSIGVNSVFGPKAGIGEQLFGKELGLGVSRIQQDAFILFDERGTEAAAKTEMGIEILSKPPADKVKNKEFFADRPFLFFVVDQQGIMYFAGKVSQPAWD